jgi:hypothetical protein
MLAFSASAGVMAWAGAGDLIPKSQIIVRNLQELRYINGLIFSSVEC